MRDRESTYNREVSKASPQYFTALDGFRGLLAILIAIYHTMWMSHANSSALLTNGPPLVDLFFVFSGFLMFTLYNGRINSGAEGREFIKRRIARIYPLHFFMLLVALLYAVARVVAHFIGLAAYEPGEILPFQAGASETLWSFFTNLTLTQSMGLHDTLSYNMPSWTVSVEFYTYFIFAAMMIWARPKKLWHFGVIGALIAVNYYTLSRLKPDMDFHYDLGFWRCLGGFYTGIVTAYIYGRLRPVYTRLKETACPHRFGLWANVAEIGIVSTLFGFIIYCPGKLQFFIAPIAFVFVLGFAFDMGFISKFLGQKPFRYIAKISYSIYMVHIVISLMFAMMAENILPQMFGADWNATQTGGDILLLPYLACVLIFSHFTYHYIEMPGRRAIVAYNFGAKWKALFSRFRTSKA